MKVLIVGGSGGKESSVINKLYAIFDSISEVEYVLAINEYNSKHQLTLAGYDLILWWPDVDNSKEKHYPTKDQGAVLICSKVMREDTTRVDAVTRIFNMHGNAVMAIKKVEGAHGSTFEFELIDALNNTWCKSTNLVKVVDMMMNLYKWTKESVRVSLKQNDLPDDLYSKLDLENFYGIDEFIKINKELALKVAAGCGNRFFGNYSTRCTKLFPSTRKGKDYFFFSPRNVDKSSVTTKDLVLTDSQYYYGDRKPSVDTPVQLELYKKYPHINYMIHGHAYITNAVTTVGYRPCGDLKEVNEVVRVINNQDITRINLKNHGFLLMGKSVEDMQTHLNECNFEMIGG